MILWQKSANQNQFPWRQRWGGSMLDWMLINFAMWGMLVCAAL